MNQFIRSGSTVTPISSGGLQQTLEGTYSLRFNPRSGYYLEQIPAFQMPLVLYGNTEKLTQRILYTFAERSGSTGVLLSGPKGSGKSLLAKNLSVHAAQIGIPTIVVNDPNSTDNTEDFISFFRLLDQPCVIIMDEFEKVFEAKDQERILTLLDGTAGGQKLFVLTCNEQKKVNKHLINRPGRIYYTIDYGAVSEEEVTQYATDNLENTAHLPGLLEAIKPFRMFSFDMLVCLIEEMNRFGETAADALQYLNIRPQNEESSIFRVKVVENVTEEEIPVVKRYQTVPATFIPGVGTERHYITLDIKEDSDEDGDIYVNEDMLVSKSPNKFVFDTGIYTVTYTMRHL